MHCVTLGHISHRMSHVTFIPANDTMLSQRQSCDNVVHLLGYVTCVLTITLECDLNVTKMICVFM